jgi:hypothetical protein
MVGGIMIKRWLLIAGVLFVFGVPVYAKEPTSYRVSAIKAFLFHHENGKFGKLDVINDESVILWNTIIGEGSAHMPSEITLILVEVSGPKFIDAPGKLSVVVSDTNMKKTLTTQTIALGKLFSENSKIVSFPILIYNTGCTPIKITATLLGLPRVSKPPTLIKEIPFICGE